MTTNIPLESSNLLISRTQCPRCRKNGRDNSQDNLALYSDGHAWCYACSYHKPPSIETRIKGTTITETTNKAPTPIILPSDATVNIPEEIRNRLATWMIRSEQINKHKFMWSPSREKLIMPVYDNYGQLLMYQERTWDIALQKYLTFGKPSDIMHIIRSDTNKVDNSVLILTEDLISAIRVSSYKPAMPLWGSDIPLRMITRLASMVAVLGVWLDPDMKLKAVKDVLRASQYIPAFFIDSHLDPKFYNNDQIKEHIDICGYHIFYRDRETSHVETMTYPVKCEMDTSKPCDGRQGFRCCRDG